MLLQVFFKSAWQDIRGAHKQLAGYLGVHYGACGNANPQRPSASVQYVLAGMGCTAGPTWGVSSSLPGAEQITDPRIREAIRNQQLR